LKTKPMIDFIFIAVITLFFMAGGLYARWCGKL
jgi:cbb3-type cytochrome oxidase subunit 3